MEAVTPQSAAAAGDSAAEKRPDDPPAEEGAAAAAAAAAPQGISLVEEMAAMQVSGQLALRTGGDERRFCSEEGVRRVEVTYCGDSLFSAS